MTIIEAVDSSLVSRNELWLPQGTIYSKHRRKGRCDLDLEFQVGDWVYFKLHPYGQTSIATWQHQKLSRCPYKVLERIGQVAYKLNLPQTSKIHQVFHVSLLKPHKGEPQNSSGPSPGQAIYKQSRGLP